MQKPENLAMAASAMAEAQKVSDKAAEQFGKDQAAAATASNEWLIASTGPANPYYYIFFPASFAE